MSSVLLQLTPSPKRLCDLLESCLDLSTYLPVSLTIEGSFQAIVTAEARAIDAGMQPYIDEEIGLYMYKLQRLQTLIYLNGFTDCFMKISLHSSERL